MARAKSRFTQADVTKLIKAAKGTGFACVSIEVLPGSEGLRATYTVAPPGQQGEELSALETWKQKRAREKARESHGMPPVPIMSEKEWQASIRASELSGRERAALEALYQRRGQEVRHNEIKGAGITTQQSLQARGYAEIKMEGDRFISWRLTPEGEKFHRQIASLPPHL